MLKCHLILLDLDEFDFLDGIKAELSGGEGYFRLGIFKFVLGIKIEGSY